MRAPNLAIAVMALVHVSGCVLVETIEDPELQSEDAAAISETSTDADEEVLDTSVELDSGSPEDTADDDVPGDSAPEGDSLTDSATLEAASEAAVVDSSPPETSIGDSGAVDSGTIPVDTGTVPDAGGDAAVCAPTAVRCSGSLLQRCNAARTGWEDVATCATAALCLVSGPTGCAPPACNVGDKRCSGATLERCNGDRTGWEVVATCATADLCLASGSSACTSPACNVGDKRCSGATLERCKSGRTGWEVVATCATADLCLASGSSACAAPVCNVGDKRCTGSTLEKCNAGRTGWEVVATCATSELCAASTSSGCVAPACATGDKRCVGAGLERCNVGRTGWEPVATCITPELCAMSTASGCTAPVCAVGERRCSGNTAQICNSGRTGWTDVEICATPKTCGGGGVAGVCGGCAGSTRGPAMINLGSYCIDATEVTKSQYDAFLAAKASDTSGQPSVCAGNTFYQPKNSGACLGVYYPPTSGPNRPVTCVDWCDAVAFCSWAGKRLCGAPDGTPNAFSGLSSGEWYSACSSSGSAEQPVCDKCNCYGLTPTGIVSDVYLWPACHAAAAPYSSIFHMRGNAAEWENSCDSSGAAANCRVRGGYYDSSATQSTCAFGDSRIRTYQGPEVGFRCCFTP